MSKLIITPRTKLYDLLESYPSLEDVLIASAPQFKKLRNPVLRKTITRVTSLSQAAVIGGLNVEELVNKLRAEVGQSSIDTSDDEHSYYITDCPDWYSSEYVVNTIDIREMLHKGEQPVYEVLSELKKLKDKEILKVIAPFIPAPLLDKSLSLEYRHWLDKISDSEFLVYLKK